MNGVLDSRLGGWNVGYVFGVCFRSNKMEPCRVLTPKRLQRSSLPNAVRVAFKKEAEFMGVFGYDVKH